MKLPQSARELIESGSLDAARPRSAGRGRQAGYGDRRTFEAAGNVW
jgi:hypothetical protein